MHKLHKWPVPSLYVALLALLVGCPEEACEDRDGDGTCDLQDCGPDDAEVYPGAADPFGDDIDGDCDGSDGVDADGDGFPREDEEYEGSFDEWDCDDLDPHVYPGQQDQVGDGVDDDCDGVDGADHDGDGYASLGSGGDDCDDGDPAVHPGAEEVCDGVDNDCNGDVDDGAEDTDGDGFPDCIDPTPEGYDGPADREDPLSVQLHLHGSLSEFDATMAYHTEQANQYGIDVLWWSDHDAMIQMLARAEGLDFDNGLLTDELEALGSDVQYGFTEITDDTADSTSEVLAGGPSGTGSFWHLAAESDPAETWQVYRFSYEGDFYAHHVPLMAEATATLTIRPHLEASPDWQLQVVFSLSGNLADTTNVVTYYLGGEALNAQTDDDSLYIPLFAPVNEWTTLSFPITAAAEHFVERDDQGAHEIYLQLSSRNGVRAEVDADDWTMAWNVSGEALRDKQVDMLAERYSDGTVTHIVGQEMTPIEDTQHINVLGVDVPMHDYTYTQMLTIDQAVEYVHQQGGVALCNHPFGISPSVLYEGEAAETLVLETADDWIEAEGHACDAIEVGYQERVVDLEHHLLFWDELGKAGVFVTGVGTSDNHWTGDWMDPDGLSGSNRYHTWVFLDEPSPEGIMEQVLNGRAFFGDPLPFLGEMPLLDLWSEHGADMGQVLASDLDQVVHVETGYLEPGWSLVLIADGDVLEDVDLTGSETDTVFVVPRGAHKFIRAEVRDADENRILVSNPLFLEMP